MLSESQNIEYKESWRDEYLKWICGFANAQGGRIFIGVNDEKQVIGLPDAKKLMEDIPNKIVNYLGIVEDVNLLIEGEKEYIEIVVTPSSMPVAYRGVYHYRSGSTKQELKGLALQNFILKKMGWSWDDMPVAGATLNDIDRQAIDYFLRKGIEVGRISGDAYTSSTEAVLQSLNLITEEGQLKQAALLLFGKNPKRFFVSCDFRIGRFRNDESDLITQDVVEGNILQMVNRIIELLRSKYLLSPIHYEGITRIEQLEIPEDVLREAICNAIVHRDYMGVHTQMKVYDDCIMLWNDGKLPEGIDQEKLFAEHASQPRNRNIANAFYKAGFIETWGRGINKIRQGLKKEGLPEPKIENHVSGTLITIYRNVGVNGTNDTNNVGNMSETNVGNMSETNVGNMSETNLTERQRFILSSIKKNPLITGKEMSETLSVTQRTVERDLAAMQKAGIIRHEGKVNAGVWVVLEKPQKKRLRGMKETKFKNTEIGEIPEDWEVRTINSFCSVKTGPFGSMLHAEDYVAKGTPIVTTEHFKNGILPLVGKDIPQVGIEDLKRMSSYTLTKDDIVFSRVGSVDINALVTVRQKGWLFSGRVLRVRPFKQTDSLYLHYGLLKHSVRSDIVSRAVGLTMASINTKILGETELSLPPLNEQHRIASALTNIDNLISSLDKLIEKKKNIKQGTMQQLLTGKIRLKGFDEPWVKRKLGDNTTIQRGGSPRPIEAYLTTNRDGINWIKIGDVRPNDKFIRHTVEKIIPEGISHSRQVYKGDFILSNSMSFGRPYILDIDGCIHDGWLVIKDYSNIYDMDFLYYILSSDTVFEQYIAMAAGSSVKNLNKEKVANVMLFAPQSLAEQRAIATILNKMDNEITALETKKAKYEAIKQGMMQQLLTGKIRLIS